MRTTGLLTCVMMKDCQGNKQTTLVSTYQVIHFAIEGKVRFLKVK